MSDCIATQSFCSHIDPPELDSVLRRAPKPLSASIEALAEQTILATRGPIEVIVVDDGSTDRMFEVAKDLQREGKIDSV